jgi:hypothetical protein
MSALALVSKNLHKHACDADGRGPRVLKAVFAGHRLPVGGVDSLSRGVRVHGCESVPQCLGSVVCVFVVCPCCVRPSQTPYRTCCLATKHQTIKVSFVFEHGRGPINTMLTLASAYLRTSTVQAIWQGYKRVHVDVLNPFLDA